MGLTGLPDRMLLASVYLQRDKSEAIDMLWKLSVEAEGPALIELCLAVALARQAYNRLTVNKHDLLKQSLACLAKYCAK